MLGLAILAAGAATVSAGYQSMAPTGQWYGQTFTGLPRGSKQLALTYDDGPNDPHTLRLLEVLDRHQVKATFFMIGRHAEQCPEVARAVAAAGHEIGNHTYSHPNLIFCSVSETKKEIEQCGRALTEVVGPHSNLFRPPFGGRRPQSLRIARALGLKPVMWNITGWDWNAPPAEVIVKKVSHRIHCGNVVLLHDGGHAAMSADRSQTVIATDRLIDRYKAEGYTFVTVSEMMP